jgi:peptidoglycan/xylan/chitin deacetylase (PgdA/CDA1 family)
VCASPGSRCSDASCDAAAGSARDALTFADGPHPVTTRRVLEALAPTRHRATFFVLDEKAQAVGNIKQMVEDAIEMVESFFDWVKGLFA